MKIKLKHFALNLYHFLSSLSQKLFLTFVSRFFRGMVPINSIKERLVMSPEEEKVVHDTGYQFGLGGFSEAVYYRT